MENRLDLFNKTYETLVTAWEKGELMHGDCYACAVGNICGGGEWSNVFVTMPAGRFQERNFTKPDMIRECLSPGVWEKGIKAIAATGYNIEELARVEYAFESSISHNYHRLAETPEGQYIGLCAVMDVLWDIHGIEDKSLTALNSVAVDKGGKR